MTALSPADRVRAALAGVNDPEIKRPITDLGMVRSVDVGPDGQARIEVLLTVAGCPMKDTITRDVTAAALAVAGVSSVDVVLDVMSAEQRKQLQSDLRGARGEREIPFAQPGSLTKVFAVASGKGGVGKSSVTVNLALAMAERGLAVGIVDADIYGHSIPAMLGIADQRPTQVEDMILPVPALGVRVISIGMLKPRRDQVVAWRGPMLDRALVQMLSDVYWGDLDVLLLDLPPGTGDVAISVGQHLPSSEVLVVTTPQQAAAEVAERAGTIASMMHQRVVGVIENMSYLACPHCGPDHRLELFGSGGGARVAETLSRRFGYPVRLLGEIPLDPQLLAAGDDGVPLVRVAPDQPAAEALREVAATLASGGRSLAGRQLGLAPAGRR
ncbi:MAG TPA: Mrp/NBP35 family ATP-binding protein [Nocardioidaceae bacterium]|jgi:ATP-binding protein involved in chromosome partitioning|nr:Mrp/NBP35 family ATP-binding protein [Nocardioidaceae bacterium]